MEGKTTLQTNAFQDSRSVMIADGLLQTPIEMLQKRFKPSLGCFFCQKPMNQLLTRRHSNRAIIFRTAETRFRAWLGVDDQHPQGTITEGPILTVERQPGKHFTIVPALA